MKNNAYKRLKMDECAGKQLLSVSLRIYLRVKDMCSNFEKLDLMINLDYLLNMGDQSDLSVDMDVSLVEGRTSKPWDSGNISGLSIILMYSNVQHKLGQYSTVPGLMVTPRKIQLNLLLLCVLSPFNWLII